MPRRPKRHRWARRSLLFCAGWFLLLQAGLLLSLERRGLEAFDPVFHNRLRLLRECQKSRPDSPLCLVMGSSRVDLGFLPEMLPECTTPDGRRVTFFNFGNYGAGPLMQRLMLQRLRQEGVRPDWLVLELMPPYLCQENNHFFLSIVPGRELPLVAPYLPAWQLAQYALRRRRDLLPGHCHDLLLRHTGLDLGGPKLLGAPLRLPLGGTAALEEHLSEEDRQKRTAVQCAYYRRDLGRFAISPRSDRVLGDILAGCRRDGIDVTLVVTPEGPAFRSLYREGSDAVLAGYLDLLKRQTGVPIVNARDWLDERDFTDSHHPTGPGARKLTSRLYAEVLRPLSGRSPPAGQPRHGPPPGRR